MTEQEFIVRAKDLVKHIVDSIADKEYRKLAHFTQINSNWRKAGQTQEAAFVEFGEWLDEQLAMWEQDEERKFVIDHFNESCLEKIEVDNNQSLVTYNPTNAGEELDLWFEIDFKIENDSHIISTFNVNL